jgi:hypothetical protein
MALAEILGAFSGVFGVFEAVLDRFGRYGAEYLQPRYSGGILSGHRTPLPYTLRTRPVGFFKSRPDTKSVPVHAFSHHKPIRFLVCQICEKLSREKLGATALRATCGVRRGELRAGGRSAPSRGLVRGGVGSSSRLQYKRLAVAAALRTLPVSPNFPHSPLKMRPRGSRCPHAARRW